VDLFQTYRKRRTVYREDIAFCHRWRDIGGRIFVIPDITMGHIGLKTYSGTFARLVGSRNTS
jgi:hypothetical protein